MSKRIVKLIVISDFVSHQARTRVVDPRLPFRDSASPRPARGVSLAIANSRML